MGPPLELELEAVKGRWLVLEQSMAGRNSNKAAGTKIKHKAPVGGVGVVVADAQETVSRNCRTGSDRLDAWSPKLPGGGDCGGCA
jgi:hypothetical protein